MTKDIALLVLRLSGLGLAFAHGWPKISRLISGNAEGMIAGIGELGFPMPVVFTWAAALTEFVGGLLITLGIGTRIAAAFAAFTMFVAAFIRHKLALQIFVWLGAASFPEETMESWGNPERAATYLLIFIALVLVGGGKLALDRFIQRK